jgi:hypothetical protein
MALAVPHFESDDYFHASTDPPFQKRRTAEERYELICRDLRPDQNWVLSGGIVGLLPCPDLDFTCIVFLYVPTPVRIERLRIRERERFGSRIEEGGDMHDTHREFIDWASRYDDGDVEGKTLTRHKAYLSNQRCTVLEYQGINTVPDITEHVLQSIRKSRNTTEPIGEPEPLKTRVLKS